MIPDGAPSSSMASSRLERGAPEGQKLRWRLQIEAPKLRDRDEKKADAVWVGIGRANLGSPVPEISDATHATVVNLATGRVLCDGREMSVPNPLLTASHKGVVEFVLDMFPRPPMERRDLTTAAATPGPIPDGVASGTPPASADAGDVAASPHEPVPDTAHVHENVSGAVYGRLWMRTSSNSLNFILVHGAIPTEFARFPCVFMQTNNKSNVKLIDDNTEDLSKFATSRSSIAGGGDKTDKQLNHFDDCHNWTVISRGVDMDSVKGHAQIMNKRKIAEAGDVTAEDSASAPVVSLGGALRPDVMLVATALHLSPSISFGCMCVDFELLEDAPGDESTLFGFSRAIIGSPSYNEANGAALLRAFNGQVWMNGKLKGNCRDNFLRAGTRFRMLLDLFDGASPGVMAVQKLGPASGKDGRRAATGMTTGG